MMSEQSAHVSVLLREAIEALNLKPDGVYIDGTLGAGGHSYEIAKVLSSGHGKLIGFDLDRTAVKVAQARLRKFLDHVVLVNKSYVEMGDVLHDLGIEHIDGILLDLGYSSMQIDDPERGFSFQHDAPLDMRFSRDYTLTAADILASYSESELVKIFSEYGEERWSKRIAERIVERRHEQPILTTRELSELILKAVPKAAQYPKGKKRPAHPATRIFQALRIAVNNELENVSEGLEIAFEILKSNGRLVVISFHSLEDRIVKRFMRSKVDRCTCPPDLPQCVCGFQPLAKLLGDMPPSPEEIDTNPRARSARLRILEKL